MTITQAQIAELSESINVCDRRSKILGVRAESMLPEVRYALLVALHDELKARTAPKETT